MVLTEEPARVREASAFALPDGRIVVDAAQASSFEISQAIGLPRGLEASRIELAFHPAQRRENTSAPLVEMQCQGTALAKLSVFGNQPPQLLEVTAIFSLLPTPTGLLGTIVMKRPNLEFTTAGVGSHAFGGPGGAGECRLR